MQQRSVLLQALMAASAMAQVPVADFWLYSTNQCAGSSFSSSAKLSVFDSNKVLTGGSWDCMYGRTVLDDGFESDGVYYTTYVDTSTIPDDCSMVLYQGAPATDELNSGQCMTYYATIRNQNGGCLETKIPKDFGYAMCCGGNCEAASSPPIINNRATLEAPKPASRDVSAVKRTNPLMKKRADCSFSGSGDSETTYGSQVRFGAPVSCPAGADACNPRVTVSYTSSTTTTFEGSIEMGASFFEIISTSVSFTVSVAEQESQTFGWDVTVQVPAGQSGYVTFQPRYECTPEGSFSGSDCLGAPTDVQGRVCYQALNFGNPDGIISFVQSNQ